MNQREKEIEAILEEKYKNESNYEAFKRLTKK